MSQEAGVGAYRRYRRGGQLKRQELKHLIGWLALPFLAVVNGAIRDATYGRVLSYDASHSLSVIPLFVVVLIWTAFLAKRWHLPSAGAAARVGTVWLPLTLAFEFGLGALQGIPWSSVLADYDITRGRLWPLIPLTTAVAPWIMWKSYGRARQRRA